MFSKFFSLETEVHSRETDGVTFATSCWEGDYENVLCKEFLRKKIENHSFEFSKKILIINNVKDPDLVYQRARNTKAFTHIYFSKKFADSVFRFFGLTRKEFTAGPDRYFYKGVDDDWIYYNALAPLSAIYQTDTPFLLYCTGDVYLEEKVDWISKAIVELEKRKIKVANLTWNEKYEEAEKESYRKTPDFFIAKEGFSDQLFLVKTKDFRKPIYSEIRKDSSHFPRGDVFEKRVYSYMKNRGWERIIYRKGAYIHEG